MARTLVLLALLALSACSALPASQLAPSACDAGEATYACQVERYHNISG